MGETDPYKVSFVDQMPLKLHLWGSAVAVAVAADSLQHLGTLHLSSIAGAEALKTRLSQ